MLVCPRLHPGCPPAPLPPPPPEPPHLQGAKMFRGCRRQGLHLGTPIFARYFHGKVSQRTVSQGAAVSQCHRVTVSQKTRSLKGGTKRTHQ